MNGLGRIGKLIAVAVLAAFLPGSLLNVAPVVWCVAGKDHSALEIRIGAGGHAPLRWHGKSHEHALDAAGPQAAAGRGGHHSGPCTDYDLIGSALHAGGLDPGASALDAAPASGIPCTTALYRAAPSGAAAIRSPPAERAVSAHLLDLRTIKLRL